MADRLRSACVPLLIALGLAGMFAPAGAAPRRAPQDEAALMRDTLAWVGGRAITALDLVQRIEWMPWPGKQGGGGLDTAKVRALHSLAGEELLAQEAERQGLELAPEFVRMRFALRRALARDALYREVTSDLPRPSALQVDRVVRRLHPHARAAELPGLRRAAADSLRQLAARERAADFMGRLLAPQRVVVDSATFLLLADSLRSLMLAAQSGHPTAPVTIPTSAPDALLEGLRTALGRRLAALPDGPFTLGDAIEDLRVYPFEFHSLARRPFALELNAHMKTMVEGELLAREALRRHLDERPEVQHDLRLWCDAWSAQLMLPQFARGAAQPASAVAGQMALLARRTHVRFDYAALRRVDISPANMVTKRLLGFGGGMVAAPPLMPLWEWVDPWRAERPPLP